MGPTRYFAFAPGSATPGLRAWDPCPGSGGGWGCGGWGGVILVLGLGLWLGFGLGLGLGAVRPEAAALPFVAIGLRGRASTEPGAPRKSRVYFFNGSGD
jgi:hypothetical protein